MERSKTQPMKHPLTRPRKSGYTLSSSSEGERAGMRGPSHRPNRCVRAESRTELRSAVCASLHRNMTKRLSRYSWGRVLLHLAVLMRRRRNLRWHLAGMRREL